MAADLKSLSSVLVVGSFFGLTLLLLVYLNRVKEVAWYKKDPPTQAEGAAEQVSASVDAVAGTMTFTSTRIPRSPGLAEALGDLYDKVVAGSVWLGLAIAFLFGMFIDSASNSFADLGWWWPDDGAIRLSVFTSPGSRYHERFASLVSEGKLNNPVIIETLKGAGKDAGAIDAGRATAVYYEAKNRVYRNTQYAAELTEMDVRLRFCRAMMLASFLLFLVAAGIGSIGWDGWRERDRSARIFAWGLTMAVITVTFLVALGSYLLHERAYDIRVYGYYLSLATDSDSPEPG